MQIRKVTLIFWRKRDYNALDNSDFICTSCFMSHCGVFCIRANNYLAVMTQVDSLVSCHLDAVLYCFKELNC